jgi:hypothetical protein
MPPPILSLFWLVQSAPLIFSCHRMFIGSFSSFRKNQTKSSPHWVAKHPPKAPQVFVGGGFGHGGWQVLCGTGIDMSTLKDT